MIFAAFVSDIIPSNSNLNKKCEYNPKKFYAKILRESSTNLHLAHIFEDRGLFLC